MDDKKTQIFSDEMHEQYARFSLRVKGDTSGIAKLTMFVLVIFTALLLFWWKLIGAPIEYLYAVNWFQRYPTTPIQESVTWNILQGMEIVTTVFLAITWLYIILYAITFFSTKKSKKDTIVIPNSAGGWDENPKPQGAKRACPNCTSSHVRNGGGKNKGKNYCMTCRKFF
jgi:preprotein translocase subunit SecG